MLSRGKIAVDNGTFLVQLIYFGEKEILFSNNIRLYPLRMIIIVHSYTKMRISEKYLRT